MIRSHWRQTLLVCSGALLFALSSERVSAQVEKKVEEELQEKLEKNTEQTRSRRALNDYFVFLNYSPLDLLIPNKWGLTLGYNRDANRTWELEYLHGGLSVPFILRDLGSMSDDRLSFIQRSYRGSNSFNFSYGVTYFDFAIHLGDRMLNTVNKNYPAVDLVKIQALGANIGIGQRWNLYKDITFGVDYITWAQPLIILNKDSAFLDHSNSSDESDNVRSAMSIISYFPRFVVVKMQIGILF